MLVACMCKTLLTLQQEIENHRDIDCEIKKPYQEKSAKRLRAAGDVRPVKLQIQGEVPQEIHHFGLVRELVRVCFKNSAVTVRAGAHDPREEIRPASTQGATSEGEHFRSVSFLPGFGQTTHRRIQP